MEKTTTKVRQTKLRSGQTVSKNKPEVEISCRACRDVLESASVCFALSYMLFNLAFKKQQKLNKLKPTAQFFSNWAYLQFGKMSPAKAPISCDFR